MFRPHRRRVAEPGQSVVAQYIWPLEQPIIVDSMLTSEFRHGDLWSI